MNYSQIAFQTIKAARQDANLWSMAEAQARIAVLKSDTQTARILLAIAQRRGK